jgi:hypothetical protein
LIRELGGVFELHCGQNSSLSIWLGPSEILLRAGNSILQEARGTGLLIGIIGPTPKAGSVSWKLSKRSDGSEVETHEQARG